MTATKRPRPAYRLTPRDVPVAPALPVRTYPEQPVAPVQTDLMRRAVHALCPKVRP